MTEEEKKLLKTFETQLRHLIYIHDELKRENAELKKLLDMEKLKNEKVQDRKSTRLNSSHRT